MTREGRENLLAAAIVFSVAAHVALMFGIRAKVMTHVDRSALRSHHREAMHVGEYEAVEDPVRIERIKDIMSAKEAPEAEADEPVGPATEQLPDDAKQHWDGDVPAPSAPELSSVPVPAEKFDASPLKLPESMSPDPLPAAEFSVPQSRALTAPELAPGAVFAMPAAFGAPEAKLAVPTFSAEPVERAAIAAGNKAEVPEFVPSQEIYDKVDEKIVLIAGTQYNGEIKKSIFSVMNYLMPVEEDVLPMHSSANMDPVTGETAVFFGLSGTGKTTLSADTQRVLIGDDEHGWAENSIFNFEGGCYAKAIKITPVTEPQIYEAIRFGSICENVVVNNATRVPDYFDDSLTENTRVAYPVDYIENAAVMGQGRYPNVVIFLTADAFGVLPPISRLDTNSAMYHFLSGFTSKVAGTERGVTEPQPTFSTLFGEPFMPLDPLRYARMFGERMERIEYWWSNSDDFTSNEVFEYDVDLLP